MSTNLCYTILYATCSLGWKIPRGSTTERGTSDIMSMSSAFWKNFLTTDNLIEVHEKVLRNREHMFLTAGI